ncbi:MAG: hypothetical protein JO316_08465 [Abitibacteriaceae bacterium]|nr:hypothetical protein [Abditibacteriaceae bacterium]MBV9865368.1 hypothetical protein [Abditibacteriaceae bacterium]
MAIWLAPLVTFIVALIGFAAKYLNDKKIAERKDRLDRINQQLKLLYGPLYATDQAAKTAWIAFRAEYRPGKESYWQSTPPPTKGEAEAWRLWMTEVFMPLNLRLEKTVGENADLLIEERIPECLLLMVAHVSAYKAVLKRWENGDFSEHVSLVSYPFQEVRTYVETSFMNLKKEQARLLGLLEGAKDHLSSPDPEQHY